VPIPHTLGGLTTAELDELREHGPYTRDPRRIKVIADVNHQPPILLEQIWANLIKFWANLLNFNPPDLNESLMNPSQLVLDWPVVKVSLYGMFKRSMDFVKQVMQRNNVTDVRQLTLARVCRSQTGRPDVSGKRVEMEILPAIIDCDTCKKIDMLKIHEHSNKHLTPGDPNSAAMAAALAHMPPHAQAAAEPVLSASTPCVVKIMRGDGQSSISMANMKAKCAAPLPPRLIRAQLES
jgi:hypothetical protein